MSAAGGGARRGADGAHDKLWPGSGTRRKEGARRPQSALKEQRGGTVMKASRKLSRSSFVMRVAGEARRSGKGKGGTAPASDHDLAHPPGGGGADPDSGPQAGPDGRPT
jgi:hypothetical protein